MSPEKQFQQLSDEVNKFKQDLEASSFLTEIKEYYKGFQILYSPLQFQPDFMFIGINPGAGFYKSTGQLVNRLLPEDTMEYVYENYSLARETKELFYAMGLADADLSKAVKTNFYYIATQDEKKLNRIIDLLHPMDFEKKSNEWTRQLIGIVKPKIIICEGKSAYSKIIGLTNLIENWNGDVGFNMWNDIQIIGYKRRYSNIKSKEKIIEVISKNKFSIQKN